MRRQLLAGAAVLVLATVAGCSDKEGGNPLPGGQPDPTGAQPPSSAPANAPKVANPIANLDKFMGSPCDMVTKEQAQQLGFDAKVAPEADTSQGPACEWRNEAGDDFSIVLLKNQPLGIAGIYQNQERLPDFYKYFEPVDIGGFPGVFSDSYDRRPNGMCGLSVGVTDQQVITVTDYVKQDDPCDVAKRAAEAAVATMSKG